MRTGLIFLLLIGLLAPAVLRGEGITRKGLGGLEAVPLASLSSQSMSRLGKAALAIRAAEWKHSETANFIYHYFDSFIATPVSVEAEAFYRIIAKDLGKDTTRWERKSHIFIFQSTEDWAAFVNNAALDPWTGGVHSRGELFIVRLPEFKFKGHTLAHEVAHLVVDRFFNGSNVPLWLNEGYAEYAGLMAYVAYYRARNYAAKPRSASLNPRLLLPLEQLVNTMEYPENTVTVAVFYSQSHRLVRFLSGISKSKFNQFFEQLSQGRKFDSAIYQAYGARFPNITALEKEFTPYATKDYDGGDE